MLVLLPQYWCILSRCLGRAASLSAWAGIKVESGSPRVLTAFHLNLIMRSYADAHSHPETS
jgi:hypothetical protein